MSPTISMKPINFLLSKLIRMTVSQLLIGGRSATSLTAIFLTAYCPPVAVSNPVSSGPPAINFCTGIDANSLVSLGNWSSPLVAWSSLDRYFFGTSTVRASCSGVIDTYLLIIRWIRLIRLNVAQQLSGFGPYFVREFDGPGASGKRRNRGLLAVGF